MLKHVVPKQVDRELKDKVAVDFSAKVNDFGHMPFFLSNPKGGHKCSHSSLLPEFSGSVCFSHFGVYHLKGAHNAT